MAVGGGIIGGSATRAKEWVSVAYEALLLQSCIVGSLRRLRDAVESRAPLVAELELYIPRMQFSDSLDPSVLLLFDRGSSTLTSSASLFLQQGILAFSHSPILPFSFSFSFPASRFPLRASLFLFALV